MGIIGTIGGAIGGAIGGETGRKIGTAVGGVFDGDGTPTPTTGGTIGKLPGGVTFFPGGIGPTIGPPPPPQGEGGTGVQVYTDVNAAVCPMKGYHPNKSAYWRSTPGGSVVYHERGTVCVKNRRMNPGNVRALRHAIRRVDAFVAVARRGLRHTPYMVASRSSRRGSGKKKACGCR
jgi:hypothetical protein